MSRQLTCFWVMYLLSRSAEVNVSAAATCLIAIGVSLSSSKMSILYSPEYGNLITDILRDVKVPVVINAVEHSVYKSTDIIFSNNLVMIFGRYNISRVLNESFWDAETRFFVMYDEEKEMEKEFLAFWTSRVLNVFGLLRKGSRTVVYSYLPYVEGTCGMGKPHVVDECSDGRFINNSFHSHIVEKYRNLNGCTINIGVSDIRPNVIFNGKCGVDKEPRVAGFEASLIEELSQKMNFRTMYQCFPEGVGWVMPTPGGAVGSVYKGESEFALGLLGPSMERFYYLSISHMYNVDECLIFGVPKGAGQQRSRGFELLEFEFDVWIWIFIFIMFTGFLVFFHFSNSYSGGKWLINKIDVSVALYSAFMGLSVKNPNQSSQRLSLLSWIIFSLIITVAYKAMMGSKLTVPGKVPDIDTFEGLLKSNLELTGPKSVYRFLYYSDRKDPLITAMVNRFVIRSFEAAPAVQRIVSQRDIAYLGHRSVFWYYSLISPAAKGNVHVLKRCVVSYHPSVVTRKHSFFLRRLNEIIVKLEEAGIGEFWRSKYVYSVPPTPPPFVQLTLDRFYGLFWVVAAGYVLSVLCFIVELYIGSNRKENEILFQRRQGELERNVLRNYYN